MDPVSREDLVALRNRSRKSKYLIQIYYNKLIADHPGLGNTYALLCREYYWPRMQRYVRCYMRNYIIYRISKISRTIKVEYLCHGLLVATLLKQRIISIYYPKNLEYRIKKKSGKLEGCV